LVSKHDGAMRAQGEWPGFSGAQPSINRLTCGMISRLKLPCTRNLSGT
jgi:hypothetical protein